MLWGKEIVSPAMSTASSFFFFGVNAVKIHSTKILQRFHLYGLKKGIHRECRQLSHISMSSLILETLCFASCWCCITDSILITPYWYIIKRNKSYNPENQFRNQWSHIVTFITFITFITFYVDSHDVCHTMTVI